MNMFEKIFGIKTKNLYLARLAIQKSKWVCWGTWEVTYKRAMPPKYVLVRRNEYSCTYEDIFVKSEYELANECIHDGEAVVCDLIPVISNKSRIKYKDAEEMLKSKNSVYIKK